MCEFILEKPLTVVPFVTNHSHNVKNVTITLGLTQERNLTVVFCAQNHFLAQQTLKIILEPTYEKTL